MIINYSYYHIAAIIIIIIFISLLHSYYHRGGPGGRVGPRVSGGRAPALGVELL